MPPLPFNFGVDELLRRKMTAALFVAPTLLMLLAFVPFVLLENWVKAEIGVPLCESLDVQSDAAILSAVGGLTLLLLLAAGYLLGWMLNALCWLVLARWSWTRVKVCLMHSDVPPSWMKTRPLSADEREAMREEFGRWAEQRACGARRFILIQGGLKAGGAFLVTAVLGRLFKDDPVLDSTPWPALLLGALLLGILLGTWLWCWREHRYLYRRQLLGDDD